MSPEGFNPSEGRAEAANDRINISPVLSAMRCPHTGQRGITGRETAIVLIARLVVSSAFVFAAPSTGSGLLLEPTKFTR